MTSKKLLKQTTNRLRFRTGRYQDKDV
uniref:Uncharacterized protein n=1 Tax=Rhizophora mucronata TaxID=61149 RepID=A0A2P2PZB2_RHIMU